MYVNYDELQEMVIDVNEMRNNGIKDIFDYVDNSNYSDNILNYIELLVDNDTYNLFFLGNYIGSMNSDINYNINDNGTKRFILKYILYKNPNLILDILYNLINFNTYLLDNDEYVNLSAIRKIFSISNKFEEIDSNICKTNGKMLYYIYNNDKLIGKFNYIGNYYTSKDKTVKFEDRIKINNKEFVLNNMRHYNDSRFNNIVLDNANKCKSKIK